MRILQVLQHPGDGGAEQYAFLLAKEARESGDENYFLFGGDGPFVTRAKNLGAHTGFLEMRFPGDPSAAWKLSRYLKEHKIDVIQTHFMRESSIAVLAAKLAGVKAVFTTIHRIEPKSTLQALFNRKQSAGLSKMIAVSPLVKEYLLKEGISAEKIEIVPIGVDLEEIDRVAIRKKLGVAEDAFLISCVGRFSPEKGQKVLLEAFAKLGDPKVKLVFVGDGPTLEPLQKMAGDLRLGEKVIFAGRIDDGYTIAGSSNLYIQPSEIETLSLSVIEAMTLGVPVIASNNEAHVALLDDGALGFLFENGSPESLREKIEAVVGDYKGALAKTEKAKRKALEQFTSQEMWRTTRALYASAIAPAGQKMDWMKPRVEKESVPS